MKHTHINLTDALCYRDHYFTAVSWISLTEICVVWLNRPQNLSIVTICSSPKWDCREVGCLLSDYNRYSYRTLATIADITYIWIKANT